MNGEAERTHLIKRILELDLVTYRAFSRTLPKEWLTVDLTMPQLKVLFMLFSEGPSRVGALAAALGVGPPTLTGILDRLVRHGLVSRKEDPADRRVVISQLTDSGRKMTENLHQLGRARWSELLESMSLEELKIVAQALDIMHKAALRWQGSREAKGMGRCTQ
ncbi:MAG: MarR family transcriptional regulator [Chloroflexota bacterium]|nr:MarR family transcriptional regulator [Chloroflexota bacterium]